MSKQRHRTGNIEAIGQLTGDIAHELNNLLTIILGNLELLDEVIEADSRERRLTRAALDAARRAAELNTTLLRFSDRR